MFAPVVITLRNAMGSKEFNKVRGQAIRLHSQVITRVCDRFGVGRATRQNLIRKARDNGKVLGLLA